MGHSNRLGGETLSHLKITHLWRTDPISLLTETFPVNFRQTIMDSRISKKSLVENSRILSHDEISHELGSAQWI